MVVGLSALDSVPSLATDFQCNLVPKFLSPVVNRLIWCIES